jgi:hypothetical protein
MTISTVAALPGNQVVSCLEGFVEKSCIVSLGFQGRASNARSLTGLA